MLQDQPIGRKRNRKFMGSKYFWNNFKCDRLFLRPKQKLSLPLAASELRIFPPNIPFGPTFLHPSEKEEHKNPSSLFTRAVWDTQARECPWMQLQCLWVVTASGEKEKLPCLCNYATCPWVAISRFRQDSLVVQWLRIYLPMQGTWVQSLVWEDSTCRRATKPMYHNYWAWALEPMSGSYWAPMP